jgi:hypothetical protein
LDPTAALWILGSIASGFIVLLGIVFTAISFLISRAGREYELTKRMVAEYEKWLVKEYGSDVSSLIGKLPPDETARKSVKNLLSGVRASRLFFPGSFVLIMYCLFSMMYVGGGGTTEVTSWMVAFAVAGAGGLLVSLYLYMNWCLDAALNSELRWVSKEEKFKEFSGMVDRFLQFLEEKGVKVKRKSKSKSN